MPINPPVQPIVHKEGHSRIKGPLVGDIDRFQLLPLNRRAVQVLKSHRRNARIVSNLKHFELGPKLFASPFLLLIAEFAEGFKKKIA